MHVSLSRRTYRVGLSMQYWVWFCFGLLAVVPWQVIRGQDSAGQTTVDHQSSEEFRGESRETSAIERGKSKVSHVSKPDPAWLSVPSPRSLIFRGQNPPPEARALAPGYDMTDLGRDLGLAAVVVCRPGLGTLNHSVLTVEHLRAAGVEVAGLVVCGMPSGGGGEAERTNLTELPRLTGAKVVGVVPSLLAPGAARVDPKALRAAPSWFSL